MSKIDKKNWIVQKLKVIRDMKMEKVNIVLEDEIIFVNICFSKGKIDKIDEIANESKKCKKYVLPGLIDPHVHLRDPGLTEKEDTKTGTLAALNGGITTVFDMPNTKPAVIDKKSFLEKKKIFEEKAKCNWGLFLGVTEDNLEELEKFEDEKLVGFKLYLGSTTGNLLVGKKTAIKKVFEIAKKRGLIISVHAESEAIIKEVKKDCKGNNKLVQSHSDLRPPAAAIDAVEQVIELCRKTKAKVNICHTSTKGELDLIEEAKVEGLPITCEVAPHHLFLTTQAYESLGNFALVNPPLRAGEDMQGVWWHLEKGTVDMIATDHAPHTIKEKNQRFGKAPSGMPGLETSLPLMLMPYHLGKIDLIKLSKLVSGNAARIWDLSDRGVIAEGKTADLIVIDFNKDWKIESKNLKTKCRWSAWNGLKVKGALDSVYLRGKKL